MKILAVGDPHFRLDLPYADHFEDRRKGERAEVLAAIHKAAASCDAVVLMGDNLDKRHNHSSVIKEFTDFLDGFGHKDLYIISGNHETYEGTRTAIDFLIGKRSNWHIMTPSNGELIHWKKIGETVLGFVPYATRSATGAEDDAAGAEALMELIETRPMDVIFMHHAISGTRALGAMTDLFTEIVLPRERLELAARVVVGGHIHQPSVTERTIVTGSIFTQEMGETYKCVWEIDTADHSFREIPLPVRPIYKMEVSGTTMEAITDELDALDKRAIVKFITHDPSLDLEVVKEKLSAFDASILLEDYPSERARLHVDETQTFDMSVESLLNLYAEARNKDPKRLQEAFRLLQEER